MNKSNLVSLGDRPEQERKEIARKGGKAAGKVRREKKSFCRLLLIALDELTTDPQGRKVTRKELAAIMLANKMAEGDLKAIELGLNILGEKFAFLEESNDLAIAQ